MARPTKKGMIDSREHPRVALAAMYTLVRVRPRGQKSFPWTGHIYDLSASGMRLELDGGLEPGTQVEVRAMLPGAKQTTFTAAGHIVRQHDDADEAGPVRMGMVFEKFLGRADRKKVESYLSDAMKKAA